MLALSFAPVLSLSTSTLATKFASNPAASKTFRRAEFWDQGSATLLDIVNVLGRWEDAEEWKERSEFAIVDKPSEFTKDQAATEKRYQMANRLGYAERVALQMNVPELPFRDSALAASVGLSVEDFAELPINPVAVNVVFDALSESKSSLLKPEVITQRRAGFFNAEGGISELAFSAGLIKARTAVIISWFVFGKGNLFGLLILLKVVSDTTGLFDDFFGTLMRNQEGVLAATGMFAAMAAVGQQDAQEEERKAEEKRLAREAEQLGK